jgi:hypothetical protein
MSSWCRTTWRRSASTPPCPSSRTAASSSHSRIDVAVFVGSDGRGLARDADNREHASVVNVVFSALIAHVRHLTALQQQQAQQQARQQQ